MKNTNKQTNKLFEIAFIFRYRITHNFFCYIVYIRLVSIFFSPNQANNIDDSSLKTLISNAQPVFYNSTGTPKQTEPAAFLVGGKPSPIDLPKNHGPVFLHTWP